MTVQLKMSSKGQVVVPKRMRDRLGWSDGARIDVIEQADRLTLLAQPRRGSLTINEALAKIRALSPYRGPPITIDDMDDAVLLAVGEEYERSCNR